MKVLINGVKYTIKEMTQKEYKELRQKEDKNTGCEITDTKKGVWYGASHHYQDTIIIDKNLSKERKRKVLIHELVHCYISEHVSHVEKEYSEEDVADICSNSFDFINKTIDKYFKSVI